jgi:hypothetical protein
VPYQKKGDSSCSDCGANALAFHDSGCPRLVPQPTAGFCSCGFRVDAAWHFAGCERHAQQDPRPIGAVMLERGIVLTTFNEDNMIALTPDQRRQATLGLSLLMLHLERIDLEARNRVRCQT